MSATTQFTVITGEELSAHKAEWIKTYPDCLPPWESKYGAAMNDETQWPPIWKDRIEECPEYEVLAPYLRHNSPYSTLLLQQLRESRGYDATVSVSCDELICYTPLMMSGFSHISTVICKYVTDKINDRAKTYHESYVFDEVKKIVRTPGHYFYTFTVKEEASSYNNALKTVQAYVRFGSLDGRLLVYLKEWRFKPVSSE